MTTWHGYEQHPDAHPERPWWRRVVTAISETPGWERAPDSYFIADDDAADPEVLASINDWSAFAAEVGPALARIDAEHPLPAPEPRCGQVWTDGEVDNLVTAVVRSPLRGVAVAFGPQWHDYGAAWPPSGAVLVAGPGAPWQDTREVGP